MNINAAQKTFLKEKKETFPWINIFNKWGGGDEVGAGCKMIELW